MIKRRYGLLGAAILIWAAVFPIVGRIGSLAGEEGSPANCPHSIALWVIALVLMVALVLLPAGEQRQKRTEISISLLDPVTGLYNRRAFASMAHPLMETAQSLSEKALVLVVSVHRFDAIEATGEERAAEAALLVAEGLRDSLRGSDLMSRYNDDEFVCFLAKASTLFAEVIVERIRENVAARNRQFSGPVDLDVMVGVAEFDPVAPLAIEKLVKAAYDDLFKNLAENAAGD